MIGSSLPRSWETVHDGEIRRSEEMSGAELGEAEFGTVIMMAMSAAVERDMLTQCFVGAETRKSSGNMACPLVQ